MASYALLSKLINVFDNEEGDHTRWKENCTNSGVADDLGLACIEDNEHIEEFDRKVMVENDDHAVYAFMGSEYEEERFYALDIVVFESPDGRLWCREKDVIKFFEF